MPLIEPAIATPPAAKSYVIFNSFLDNSILVPPSHDPSCSPDRIWPIEAIMQDQKGDMFVW